MTDTRNDGLRRRHREHSPEAADEANLISDLIDDAREERGITKAEVARRMRREPSAIYRLLNRDEFNPELRTLIELAHAVGLEVKLERKKRAYRRKDQAEPPPHVRARSAAREEL